MGLRFYRRLLQVGITSTELWNNLGLSCFYASQVPTYLQHRHRARLLSRPSYQHGPDRAGNGLLGSTTWPSAASSERWPWRPTTTWPTSGERESGRQGLVEVGLVDDTHDILLLSAS